MAVPTGRSPKPARSGPPTTARGMRTRETLVAASRVVFSRDGFLDARIADIAEEAGVAHGTFYTYFESKEQILREVALSLQEEMLAYRSDDETELAADDHFGRLRRANRQFLESYRHHARLITVVDQVATFNEQTRSIRRDGRSDFIRRIQQSIEDLQRQGVSDQSLDPRYVANALGSMVERFAYIWFELGEPFEMEQAVDTLTVMWAGAIGLRARERT